MGSIFKKKNIMGSIEYNWEYNSVKSIEGDLC